MHISAKVDYAVRALTTLAAAGGGPLPATAIADDQEISTKFLEGILAELRRAGVVTSQRGAEGGYRLARPASEVTIADVMRAIDGPLAQVRGRRPELVSYAGSAEHLQTLWIAVRASLREVLERTTIADLESGNLPEEVTRRVANPDAWNPRSTAGS